MPKLLDEMRRYLGRWQDDLPSAWRTRLDGVAPKLDAIPRDASLDLDARIVPVRRDQGRVFYALEGIDPSDVNAVMLGNDPYSDPIRATGRSFEQGDLTEWTDDLREPGRVTRSLLSLVCAAAALHPDAKAPGLDSSGLCDRREKLLCGLQEGKVVLPPARSMFENLTGQGVLWINRTPTMSVLDTRQRREGSSWRAIDEQRKWHRALNEQREDDEPSVRFLQQRGRREASGHGSKTKGDAWTSRTRTFASWRAGTHAFRDISSAPAIPFGGSTMN